QCHDLSLNIPLRCLGRRIITDRFRCRSLGCAVRVVRHQEHARQEQETAEEAYEVTGIAGLNCFNEAVGECAVGIEGTPHQTLHDAVHPHGGDVQHSTDGCQPEVDVDQAHAEHLFTAEQDRQQVINRTDGDHRHPAQSAGVYV